MAKGLINESTLNNLGNAINVLNGTSGTYHPSEMADEILDVIPDVTVEGNPIHITDAANYPAVSCVTTLEPVQEGSGDPSPENVRPITGHTGTELTRTGKNLISDGTNTDNGYVEGRFLKNDNTSYPAADYYISEFFPVLSSVNYVLSCNRSAPNAPSICFYDEDKTFISGVKFDNNKTTVIATPNNSAYARCSQRTAEVGLMQFELGTSATTIEPYTPETHTRTFPQAQSPVYGCEVDWINGVLRVDTAFKTIDDISNFDVIGRTYANCLYGSYAGITKGYPNDKLAPTSKFKANILTLDTGYHVWQRTTPNTFGPNDSGTLICQFGNLTEQELQALLQETPLQLCYELATPIEIPLTPEVITLLKGENNIWTDARTSEIEYKVDLQSYIQKLIDEASGTASALSVSPLSLGKSAALTSTDGDNGEKIEEVDEPLVFDKEAESEISEKDPDTLEKGEKGNIQLEGEENEKRT